MESVERTVDTPNRLAIKLATVDLPVPDVPPIRTIIGIFLSIFKSFTYYNITQVEIFFNMAL